MLTRDGATFELARLVRIGAAELGNVFSFCSGLYFRGKLAYARRFAKPPDGTSGVQIITPSRGLIPAGTLVGLQELGEFAAVPVDSANPRFTEPLRACTRALAALDSCEFILLGSIATGKYLDTLLPVLGERLLFPEEFAGRGDMSRGALLLRAVAGQEELKYKRVARAPKQPVWSRRQMKI